MLHPKSSVVEAAHQELIVVNGDSTMMEIAVMVEVLDVSHWSPNAEAHIPPHKTPINSHDPKPLIQECLVATRYSSTIPGPSVGL